MSMNEANDFLNEYGGPMLPIVAFEQIGNIIVGKIVGTARVRTQTQDGGVESKVLAIPLEVVDGSSIPCGKAGDRRPAQRGEQVALWVKAGGMASALQDALNKVHAPGLSVGGTLAMKYTGDGARSPGKSPPKQYLAQYLPPVASVGLDDLLPAGGPTAGNAGDVASPPVTQEELF